MTLKVDCGQLRTAMLKRIAQAVAVRRPGEARFQQGRQPFWNQLSNYISSCIELSCNTYLDQYGDAASRH